MGFGDWEKNGSKAENLNLSNEKAGFSKFLIFLRILKSFGSGKKHVKFEFIVGYSFYFNVRNTYVITYFLNFGVFINLIFP